MERLLRTVGCHSTPLTEIPQIPPGAAGRGPGRFGVEWPRNMGNADGRAVFFAWVGPTRFRRAALVVIQPGAAELRPQRLRRGLGPYAILPQRALEGVEGGGRA